MIGWSDGELLRDRVVDESPLGNVIADAQLAATQDAAGAVAAFGIRADPGGDRFPVLRSGTKRAGGALDLDAFEAHFAGTTRRPRCRSPRRTGSRV